MNLSVVALIKLGMKYMKLWPQRAELANYFADYNAVQVARFVYRYFPSLAVFSIALPFALSNVDILPQMFFYSLLLASMPVQALVILGVKADKVLPPSLAQWYREGVAKYNQQGGEIKLSAHKPRYMDLAQLLNISYQNQLK